MNCKYCGREIKESEFSQFFTKDALENMPCSPECKDTLIKKHLEETKKEVLAHPEWYNPSTVKEFKDQEFRDRGLVRFNELSVEARVEAYQRFTWDFVNNKPNGKPQDVILSELSKHWFDKNGATYLGTY